MHLIRAQAALVAQWHAEATDPMAPLRETAQLRASAQQVLSALGKYKVMIQSKELVGSAAELARALQMVIARVEELTRSGR